jgi:hypothetical protein
MSTQSLDGDGAQRLDRPLLRLLRDRRARRFTLGASLENGPLAFRSERDPIPLTDEERAFLAFAACGISGWALNDLSLGPGQGGTMMGGLVGRTISSVDALQTICLVVADDDGTWLVRRPQDLAPADLARILGLVAQERLTDAYRALRVRISERRVVPPLDPPDNIPLNRWNGHGRGTTYFLPIGDVTLPLINVILEFLNEENAAFPLDERASWAPAGIGRFARSRGGHLDDSGRSSASIRDLEASIGELIAIEMGMSLQNLGLACEALGLGGYPNYAGSDAGWMTALGFRMETMPLSRYLGVGPVLRTMIRLRRLEEPMSIPTGLPSSDGGMLLEAYRPPHFSSMRAAVEAVVERKLGPDGIYRARAAANGPWQDGATVSSGIPPVSDAAVEATVAYCEYVFDRYGRFPAHLPAFHVTMGFQAGHLDVDFYDRHYRPDALSDRHRNHLTSGLHH